MGGHVLSAVGLVLVMTSHRLAATLALVLSTSILATLGACGDPAGPKSDEPPRVNVAITIGDTIRGESLETAAHVDGFTFQGQQGDELIGYVRSLATDPRAVIRMLV